MKIVQNFRTIAVIILLFIMLSDAATAQTSTFNPTPALMTVSINQQDVTDQVYYVAVNIAPNIPGGYCTVTSNGNSDGGLLSLGTQFITDSRFYIQNPDTASFQIDVYDATMHKLMSAVTTCGVSSHETQTFTTYLGQPIFNGQQGQMVIATDPCPVSAPGSSINVMCTLNAPGDGFDATLYVNNIQFGLTQSITDQSFGFSGVTIHDPSHDTLKVVITDPNAGNQVLLIGSRPVNAVPFVPWKGPLTIGIPASPVQPTQGCFIAPFIATVTLTGDATGTVGWFINNKTVGSSQLTNSLQSTSPSLTSTAPYTDILGIVIKDQNNKKLIAAQRVINPSGNQSAVTNITYIDP